MIAPNTTAPVEALRDDPRPLTSSTPEHNLTSADDIHNDPDTALSFSATHPLVDDDGNNSDPTPASVDFANSKEALPRPKARALGKTPDKRLRAGSNASSTNLNESAAVPAKKRAQSNALMRSAPRVTSAITSAGLAGNSVFIDFTTTIYAIQLGPNGPQFYAHESALKRSAKLAEEINKAKANRRATKQNTLILIPHDAIAFEQMLQYLYTDKIKNKTSLDERLTEMKELMSLAKHYSLPGLQKVIVKFFLSSKIHSKVPPGHFFDCAEDMYSEEIDHENGPFKLYLSRVAPMLMKGMDEATKKELVRMVGQGGGFAEQLFIAAITALDMQITLTTIKKEEMKGEPDISHSSA